MGVAGSKVVAISNAAFLSPSSPLPSSPLSSLLSFLPPRPGKDLAMHRNDNMRLMRENVGLTREINELRREVRTNEYIAYYSYSQRPYVLCMYIIQWVYVRDVLTGRGG